MAGGVGKFFKKIDMQGNGITGVADPSIGTDAVNLQYLENFLNGIVWKGAVRAATTGDLNLSSPGASIDGVSMSNGDRVLVKEQTTGQQNGIYVWNGAASAMTRATDANTSTEVKAGMAAFVSEGTTNGDKSFVLTTNDPIVLDTTPLVFTQSGSGVLPTAGNGLTLTGNTLDVGAGTGILVGVNDVSIDPAIVPRRYTNAGTHASGANIVLAHTIGHLHYAVSVKIQATGEDITGGVDITCTTTQVSVGFSASQGANTILVTAIG